MNRITLNEGAGEVAERFQLLMSFTESVDDLTEDCIITGIPASEWLRIMRFLCNQLKDKSFLLVEHPFSINTTDHALLGIDSKVEHSIIAGKGRVTTMSSLIFKNMGNRSWYDMDSDYVVVCPHANSTPDKFTVDMVKNLDKIKGLKLYVLNED